MSDTRTPEQIYLEDTAAAKEEYRIRTTDPYIHYLSIRLNAEQTIRDARALYDAAKAEAGSVYLEQIKSAWTFYHIAGDPRATPNGLNKRLRKVSK